MSNAPRFLVTELEENGSLRIILPCKKNALEMIWFGFVSLWAVFITGNVLFIWITMVFVTALAIAQGVSVFDLWLLWPAIVIIFLFLLIFIGFTSLVIFDFAWKVAGKEIVDVGANKITFVRQIWRWRESNGFEINQATNLRLEKQKTSWFPPIKAVLKIAGRDNHLALDCQGKTFRFGRDLSQTEAEQILALIQSKLSPSTSLNVLHHRTHCHPSGHRNC